MVLYFILESVANSYVTRKILECTAIQSITKNRLQRDVTLYTFTRKKKI